MPMTRWEIMIVPCLAGGNASATCLKILVMPVVDVQWPAPLSLLQRFVAQYKSLVIINNYYYLTLNMLSLHKKSIPVRGTHL